MYRTPLSIAIILLSYASRVKSTGAGDLTRSTSMVSHSTSVHELCGVARFHVACQFLEGGQDAWSQNGCSGSWFAWTACPNPFAHHHLHLHPSTSQFADSHQDALHHTFDKAITVTTTHDDFQDTVRRWRSGSPETLDLSRFERPGRLHHR